MFHPMMQDLIGLSASKVLGDWAPSDVSLLLVGHGSTKNPRSKDTLLEHIEALKKASVFGQIADLWLEEAPLVSSWSEVATQQNDQLLSQQWRLGSRSRPERYQARDHGCFRSC